MKLALGIVLISVSQLGIGYQIGHRHGFKDGDKKMDLRVTLVSKEKHPGITVDGLYAQSQKVCAYLVTTDSVNWTCKVEAFPR